jgi:hypothetical protein
VRASNAQQELVNLKEQDKGVIFESLDLKTLGCGATWIPIQQGEELSRF